jgi:hypothetical protein
VAGNSGRPGLKASSKTAAILLALTTGGTALLGRRVRMCPLTTQVDGEEHAAKAKDERMRDQLTATKPDGSNCQYLWMKIF